MHQYPRFQLLKVLPIENYDFTVLKLNENGEKKEFKIKELRGG